MNREIAIQILVGAIIFILGGFYGVWVAVKAIAPRMKKTSNEAIREMSEVLLWYMPGEEVRRCLQDIQSRSLVIRKVVK